MAQARLPPTARLRHPQAFRNAFKNGRRHVDDCFVVIVAANNLDMPRLGLAISKRRAKRAVDRNRIKRLVRERFRLAAAGLPGVDIVVLARSGTRQRDNRTLSLSLDRHWQRVVKAHAHANGSNKPTGSPHG